MVFTFSSDVLYLLTDRGFGSNLVQKRKAFYFQAVTDGSDLRGNVAFNGARSAVNFNDCFGSGSNVSENVLFNFNRETADHGKFLLHVVFSSVLPLFFLISRCNFCCLLLVCRHCGTIQGPFNVSELRNIYAA
jgi:hypothetical protein